MILPPHFLVSLGWHVELLLECCCQARLVWWKNIKSVISFPFPEVGLHANMDYSYGTTNTQTCSTKIVRFDAQQTTNFSCQHGILAKKDSNDRVYPQNFEPFSIAKTESVKWCPSTTTVQPQCKQIDTGMKQSDSRLYLHSSYFWKESQLRGKTESISRSVLNRRSKRT